MKSQRFSNRVYRKYHQSRIGKNNRHGKVSDEFIKITLEETDDHLCKFDGICPYCKGVVDYSIPGGVSSISSDRIKSGLEPYSVKNIRFCHLSCNLYERTVRGKEYITSESYKKRLTDYWGCDYISPDSAEGIELLKRNRLYLFGTKSYQINLEKSAKVVKITNKKIKNKNMNKKQKNSSAVRIELNGIGSMVFADELAVARTLYELRKLSEDESLIKSNTVNKKSGKFKKQPNSLTGRIRTYIGGLPNNTKVTNDLLSTKFSEASIPTGLLSKLKDEGLLKPTDERGVYKSISKVDNTEKTDVTV